MSKTSSVEIQMKELLEQFNEDIQRVVDDALRDSPKAVVQQLRNTSPRGNPHFRKYAEGWTSRKEPDGGVVVYNKTNWQLTHLLEDGHMIVNKKGTFGRVNGIKHIEPAEKNGAEDFYMRISRGIK